MSSSTSNSSLARSRNLRSNTLKPPSTNPPQTSQPSSGPSNVALFLTNIRLLDLDLRNDWPDITTLTFSTKDSQQNQKKRIQSVEWALYQLFALWDPEETRNKLQPFYPPLEPLQSLNLRAALFRCLEQAKKIGVLGRDTILRKTMLDECKGERLEEVLAVFSNAVLKRTLHGQGPESVAQQLALENFSYSGERTILSTLILAHKASLRTHLQEKNESRAQYDDFASLLNLNDRRIARRHEQLKQLIEDRGSLDNLSTGELEELRDVVQNNWSGSDEWLETLLYGDSRARKDGLLGARFETVWNHVESGNLGDVEGKQHIGLVEQLDARVRDQESRLARWQEFGRSLSKPGPSSPSKQKQPTVLQEKKIDLGFNRHQSLQVGRTAEKTVTSSAASLEEYTRLIENMKNELAEVGKPQAKISRPGRQSLQLQQNSPSPVSEAVESPTPLPATEPCHEEEWSSASDTEEISPGFTSQAAKSSSHTPPSEAPLLEKSRITHEVPVPTKKDAKKTNISKNSTRREVKLDRRDGIGRVEDQAASPPTCSKSPVHAPTLPSAESEADQILNSISASSPSPKKLRHTLSLAERTRLSMSRASHSKYSDLHDDVDNLSDLARLSIKSKSAPPAKTPHIEADEEKHAGLIERTRKSMAGFEAAQKKAQVERRRSIKDAKKKQRESSYFPMVEEEPVTPSIDPISLIEEDPDYESVFKSRPKIKTSPAVSPTRVVYENESED